MLLSLVYRRVRSIATHRQPGNILAQGEGPGQRQGKRGDNIAMPIGSMHGIFTYIYHEFMVNVGKYSIHGSYGMVKQGSGDTLLVSTVLLSFFDQFLVYL